MQKTIESEKFQYRPLVFRCNSTDEVKAFEKLKIESNILLINTLEEQIKDLLPCLYPGDFFSGTPALELQNRWLAGRNLDTIGNWVYFAWKNTAVRLLDEEDFIVCRTNRNKLKIVKDSQDLIGSKSILFIGLSVGQSAAVTFAMQRIGGTLHLADFDELSLTNLNRLRASVLDINVPKTVIAARIIAELDPYIQVICHNEGATAGNIDSLITQNGMGNVDLIVEECDSIEMKFLAREKARDYGVPLIMETSDRGMLDVERYDEEPGRPIFHGFVNGVTSETIKNLGQQERFGVLQKVVDYNKISDSLKRSYAALGREVLTWPQLASEVALGGATLAYSGYKILTGQPMRSGRYYVDLEDILKPEGWPLN